MGYKSNGQQSGGDRNGGTILDSKHRASGTGHTVQGATCRGAGSGIHDTVPPNRTGRSNRNTSRWSNDDGRPIHGHVLRPQGEGHISRNSGSCHTYSGPTNVGQSNRAEIEHTAARDAWGASGLPNRCNGSGRRYGTSTNGQTHPDRTRRGRNYDETSDRERGGGTGKTGGYDGMDGEKTTKAGRAGTTGTKQR